MSTILAVDTSCDACSVALNREGEVTAHHLQAPRQHTRKLLPLIDQLLAETGVKLNQLDAIAYGRGPGSFTGLRICLGVVQGLAFGSDIPVVPVSTLQTLAQGVITRGKVTAADRIFVALDARMQEVYWGCYGFDGKKLIALCDEAVNSPEDAVAQAPLGEKGGQNIIAIGPGHHYAPLQQLSVLDRVEEIAPNASDMLALVAQHDLMQQAIDAEQAEPIYLRNSVAWQKRQRIRQP